MKKIGLIITGLLLLLGSVQASQKDFIVLLDTSEFMFDDYDQLVRTYFPDVVKEHLKGHDFFHLISYAEQPELEITQKIDGKADMEVVLKRLLLLQPLGKYNDSVLAFRFLSQYTQSLPPYLPKTIIILTAGYYKVPQGLKKEDAEKEIQSVLHTLKNKGWDVRFIRLNRVGGAPEDPKNPAIALDFDKINAQEGVASYQFQPTADFSNRTLGSPRIAYPQDMGKIGRSFSFSFSVENPGESAVILRLKEILYAGDNLLKDHLVLSLNPKEKKDVSAAAEFKTPPKDGDQKGTFNLTFDDDVRAYPTQAEIRFQYSAGIEGFLMPAGIILGILVLLALVVFIIIMIRKGYERGKEMADRHVRTRDEKEERNKVQIPTLSGTSVSKAQEVSTKSEHISTETPAATPQFSNSYKGISSSSEPKTKKSFDIKEVKSPHQLLKSDTEQHFVAPLEANAAAGSDHLLNRDGHTSKGDKQSLLDKKMAPTQNVLSKVSQPAHTTPAFLQDSGGKTAAEDKILQVIAQEENAEAARAAALTQAKESSKKDFSQFLKKTESTPKSADGILAVKRERRVVQVADIQAPSRDFSLQVWTPDFRFQNTNLYPNIISLKPGERKTVGNQKASFKIVLYNVQEAVAEVFFDGGETLTFEPLVPGLFPGITESLSDCLNKEITMVLEDGKILFLKFAYHVPKVVQINNLLRGDTPASKDGSR